MELTEALPSTWAEGPSMFGTSQGPQGSSHGEPSAVRSDWYPNWYPCTTETGENRMGTGVIDHESSPPHQKAEVNCHLCRLLDAPATHARLCKQSKRDSWSAWIASALQPKTSRPHGMTLAPTSTTIAPTRSKTSGLLPSTTHPQSIAPTRNTPAYPA